MKKLLLTLIILFSPLLVSAQINLNQGGTGLTSYTAGDLIYASSNTLRFTKLNIGANGTCLQSNGTAPIWDTCPAGAGGGSGGTWSTTTSQVANQLINYPNNVTDIVTIGSNSTTTAEYWLDPNISRAFFNGNVGFGTTTPGLPLSVVGDGLVTGHFTAGDFTATSSVKFTTLTSAMLLTGADGLLAEYAGTSCTNQFPRSLSALGVATCATVANTDLANSTISGIALGANLADLTATNASLTFSGTYNGSTARTIGVNLAHNFVWTGAHDFGGAVLEISNGTAPTADDVGELAHDTTDNQLILDDLVVAKATNKIWSVTIASTSPAFILAGLLPVPTQLDGYTITAIRCHVISGTSKVIAVEDADGNSSEDITCATTVTSDDGTITNATYTAAEISKIDFGATSGTVDYVSISVFGTWTRE